MPIMNQKSENHSREWWLKKKKKNKMEILELRNTIFREYVVLSSKLNYLAYWFTVYFIWETWVWCLLKIEYVLIEGYRGAWWAAVHAVAKAQKLLSTHSPNAEIALEVKFFIYKKATSCCLNNQIWSKLLYLSSLYFL